MDDCADVVDVDAARGDVGGDEHCDLTVGESLQRTLAGHLGEVAVDRRGAHAEVQQVGFDSVAGALGLAEHQGLADAGGDRCDDLVLVHVVNGQEQVVHGADHVGRRVDRHLDRILHVALHQMADIAVERRREQHRLARCGALAQDPLDLRGEPVVGHAIGLVEHDDLDRAQVDLVLLQQVDQSQRGGDDDLDTFLEVLDLLVA